MRRVALGCALVVAGCAGAMAQSVAPMPVLVGDDIAAMPDPLPASASQGALVIGRTHASATVTVDGTPVRVSPSGRFVFGIGRDATGPVVVAIDPPGTDPFEHRIAVTPRDWPVERVAGVPPATVNPPPAIAARIAREQALVDAARRRDDAREDYALRFAWPVRGRISGRFGNRRVYVADGVEVPKAAHSGMDIAARSGTPVLAPAAGIVTFAAPDLYLTGGTVLLDHGHGVSSNFLHLSRIDVRVGQRVEQGAPIGAVGATGRASGPHLHWGMNWFGTRVDPLLLLEEDTEATGPRRDP